MSNDMRRILVGLAGAAGLCLAALAAAIFLSRGGAEAAPLPPLPKAKPRPVAETPTRRPPRPTVVVRESAYGPMLFDGRGFALYAFTRDGRGPSACTDACAAAWPPYVVRRGLRAGRGTDRSLLGVVRRSDGTRQVTYAGRPLYYYVGDREPGQVLCQNVVEFGGTWLVVRGGGHLVR